jgi:hypothetical protein
MFGSKLFEFKRTTTFRLVTDQPAGHIQSMTYFIITTAIIFNKYLQSI